MKIIVKGKHRKDCLAVRDTNSGRWKYAWGFAEMEWRDIRGKRHDIKRGKNNHMWLVVCCNDPGCDAELLVPMDEFLKLLPRI